MAVHTVGVFLEICELFGAKFRLFSTHIVEESAVVGREGYAVVVGGRNVLWNLECQGLGGGVSKYTQ